MKYSKIWEVGGNMFKLRFAAFFILALSFSSLSAEIYGKMIGGDPYASWQDGGQDFFVMFNSNIDNQITMFDDDPENPQGDTCVPESTFTLTNFHIPEDAIIEKAYLVWMGAMDPTKLDQPTDNSVKLKFTQSTNNPISYEQVVTVGDTGKLLSDGDEDTEKTFEFESITFTADVVTDCSETNMGSTLHDQNLGYFTYRADITDFFTKIVEENAAAEKDENNIFYGDYTFSDLDCTEHDFYRCKTTMVSSWAVFFVYRSKNIRPKKIYFYNGLAFVQADKSIANVSGFELPKNPVVRLTSMIAEGDPKLVNPTISFPEGIFLQGAGATSKFRLYNDCNPLMGTYVEVFNSKSSIVNWNPDAAEEDQIKCVSGTDGTGLNFGIDVDTFLLDSEKNINLQEHLKKGNTAMDVTLSVNQDAIFTNFMVLSVDNKGSNFDIPAEASDTTKSKLNFPFDREKHFCACPSNDDGKVADYYCGADTNRREFYYFIKVQDWGDEDAEDIVVTDELDKQLEYIPGTTEMATHYLADTDTYDNWTVIPDKTGNVFPLSGTGFKVSAKMVNCDQSTWSCKDTVLIRYKVKPKVGTAKNWVFNNMATIKDKKSEEAYKTNLSYPLRLNPTKCVTDTECSSPTQKMCGGTNIVCECKDNPDTCTEGTLCDGCHCNDDPAKICFNSTADFAIGKNSPQSEGTEIIVPKDNDGEPLIVGQFTLMVNNCAEDKYFNLDAVEIHINTDNDKNFSFKELELIYDVNGNGVADAEDPVIATNEVTTNYVKFFINNKKIEDKKKYKGKTLNYFLIRTKIDYNSEDILRNTTFNFYIESESSISISDQGTTMVSAGNIEFAKFMLEPTGNFFIVTVGSKDAVVPGIDTMNNNIPVLQLKTKAVTNANSITKFTVKIPVSGGYVKFGEKNGIEGVSLWIDSDKDGIGNVKVAEMTSFDVATNSVVFENFSSPLAYAPGEEKYLVVNVDFDMVKKSDGTVMAGKIEIPNAGVKVSDSSAAVIELPIKSKEFAFECKEGDVCPEPPAGSDGCKCSIVSVDQTDRTMALVIAFILLLGLVKGLSAFRKNS